MRERDIARLEHTLELLGRATITPPAPDIAGAVARRLGERNVPRRAPAWALASAAIAAGAVVLAALAGTVAPAREAIADLLERIDIFELSEVPPGTPTEIEGEPVTLAQAEQALGFEIALPDAETATPARILLQDYGAVKAAAIFLEQPGRGGFVLFETSAFAGKGLAQGSSDEPVEGFEGEAYWLQGLRIVQYESPDGRVVEESVRATDANTLVWTHDGHVFRLEGGLSQEEAVLIARSLR